MADSKNSKTLADLIRCYYPTGGSKDWDNINIRTIRGEYPKPWIVAGREMETVLQLVIDDDVTLLLVRSADFIKCAEEWNALAERMEHDQ